MGDPQKLNLLGIFFPRTFGDDGICQIYSNTETLTPVKNKGRKAKNANPYDIITSLKRRANEVNFAEVEDMAVKYMCEFKKFTGLVKSPYLNKVSVFDYQKGTSGTLSVAPTPFYMPANNYMFASFIDDMGEGNQIPRRFLGVYYEGVVANIFQTYFYKTAPTFTEDEDTGIIEQTNEGGTQLMQPNVKIPYPAPLVLNDIWVHKNSSFEQAMTDVAYSFMQAWDSAMLTKDSGNLRVMYRFVYQKETALDNYTTYFSDFALDPWDRKNVPVLHLYCETETIGRLEFHYRYEIGLIAEMKCITCTLDNYAEKSLELIRQATRPSPTNVRAFAGLMRIKNEGNKATKLGRTYGLMTNLVLPPLNADTVFREKKVSRKGVESDRIVHLVGETPVLLFSDKINLWSLEVVKPTGQANFMFLTKMLAPTFMVPLALASYDDTNVCFVVLSTGNDPVNGQLGNKFDVKNAVCWNLIFQVGGGLPKDRTNVGNPLKVVFTHSRTKITSCKIFEHGGNEALWPKMAAYLKKNLKFAKFEEYKATVVDVEIFPYEAADLLNTEMTTETYLDTLDFDFETEGVSRDIRQYKWTPAKGYHEDKKKPKLEQQSRKDATIIADRVQDKKVYLDLEVSNHQPITVRVSEDATYLMEETVR